MVSVRNFAKGKAGTILIVGGLILGGAYLAKRLNVGAAVIADLKGFGQTTGQSIISPISGLVSGVTLGTEGLATELGTSQEALFHQFGVIQDNFNRFIHPDWYTSTGCYSPANPNYGKGESSICNSANNKNNPPGTTVNPPNANLPPTSPNPPSPIATQNTANIISQYFASIPDIFKSTQTSTSNLVQTSRGLTFQNANVGSQPLNQKVGLNDKGQVRVGSIGLSEALIQKDVSLSAKLGGPVFDTQGNIVALNGVRLAR